jgi:ATP-dependent Clp protease ATP-binding subunit ClpA
MSIKELASLIMATGEDAKPTAGFQRVIQRAVIHVQSSGREEVTGANVLVAIFAERESHAAYFLQEQDMTRYDAVNFISHGIAKRPGAVESRRPRCREEPEPEGEDHREGGKKKGDALDSLLRQPQREGQDRQDRSADRPRGEVNRTIQVLCRRSKEQSAVRRRSRRRQDGHRRRPGQAIVNGEVPEVLKDAPSSLDMGVLLAGTRYRGDFEERLKQVVKEIEEYDGAIMFIDEIHTVIGAGATSGGAMDASNLLKPALVVGQPALHRLDHLQGIRQFFEKDRALVRRFQKIDVSTSRRCPMRSRS